LELVGTWNFGTWLESKGKEKKEQKIIQARVWCTVVKEWQDLKAKARGECSAARFHCGDIRQC